MRLVDRLLLREALPTLGAGLGTFTLLVAFSLYFRFVVKMITEYDVGPDLIGRFLLLGLPGAAAVAIPMAVLLATLLTFSRLSEHGELRAILVSGLSLRRIAWVPGVLGLLASLALITLNEKVIPDFAGKMEALKREAFQQGAISSEDVVRRSTYSSGHLEWVLLADSMEKDVMHQVRMLRYEDGQDRTPLMDISAERGVFIGDGVWEFMNVVTRTYLEEDRTMVTRQDSVEVIVGESPLEIKTLRSRDPMEMTFLEGRSYLAALKKRGETAIARRVATQVEMKVAVPFAAWIFALLGVGLGTSLGRQSGGAGVGFGMAILVIFFYYAMMMVGIGMGKWGANPLLSAWLPNLLFALVTFYLIVQRENPFLLAKR